MITILETTLQLTNQKKNLGKKALFLTGLGLIGTSGGIFGYQHAKENAEIDNLAKQYVNQGLSQLEYQSKN